MKKKKTSKLAKPRYDLATLAKALDGDKELALFFMEWTRNGMNATRAYLKTHPHVDEHSARVLGSRWLARISIDMVMSVYGLGHEAYFNQLLAGLNADHNMVIRKKDGSEIDLSGPDHRTRRQYHEALGKILKIEKDKPETPPVQINFGIAIAQSSKERGLEP